MRGYLCVCACVCAGTFVYVRACARVPVRMCVRVRGYLCVCACLCERTCVYVRFVMKNGKRDHVTPLLRERNWLPVTFRCQYNIAPLAYRHFEGSLLPYLSSSLCTYEPSRSLRSSNQKLFQIPKRKLKSFGQRSFSFMVPSIWNSLPATLRNVPTSSQFKFHLKTFLFAQAFQ